MSILKAKWRPGWRTEATVVLLGVRMLAFSAGLEIASSNGVHWLELPAGNGSGWIVLSTDRLGNSIAWSVLTNVVGISQPSQVNLHTPAVEATAQFYSAFLVPPGMVRIKSGTFLMGSPRTDVGRSFTEEPQTQVRFTRDLWMGKHEVTQREFTEVMGWNPSYFTNGVPPVGTGPGILDPSVHPVEQVSWSDATNYCIRLTERERREGRLPFGHEYRLPTEAEWEYACRSGTSTAFYNGKALRYGMANFQTFYEYDSEIGWINVPNPIYLGQTMPVGSYPPNEWGLYDMHGNVWEWCSDWWSEQLPGGEVIDPIGPERGAPGTGTSHVFRGGCWQAYAWYARSSFRLYDGRPEACPFGQGFRVVLAPVRR